MPRPSPKFTSTPAPNTSADTTDDGKQSLSPSERKTAEKMLSIEGRAIREGWDLPADKMDELVSSAFDTALSASTSAAARNTAIRNVLMMMGQNIDLMRIDAQQATQSPSGHDGSVIAVQYVDNWFHSPSERDIRDLEASSKPQDSSPPSDPPPGP